MASASISGLASGLDTATIISQLMQLEAISQTKLKSRVTSEQGKVTALQQLNTRLAALATSAGTLADASGTAGTWGQLKATSSNTAVAVSATSSAAATSFTLTVGQTALTHQLAFTEPHARTDVVTGGSTDVLLRRPGLPDVPITTAGGTLEQLALAINEADAGVRATLVKTGTSGGVDQFRLLVESSTTGGAEEFALVAADGSPLLGGATVRAGRDAAISIGGIQATSTTNTFAGIVPGVTVTLGASATGTSDVSISHDASARSTAVKTLVSDMNQILDTIRSSTRHDKDAAKAGVLSGDSTLRRVADTLVRAIYPANGTSLAGLGIEVDRYGRLTFDEEAFATAYAADPDRVTAAITGATGLGARVEQVATAASDRFDGAVTTAIQGRTSAIDRLNDSIAAWDDRLALRRAALERQYTALERALSNLQGQSNWLTGQLASLPSYQE